MSAPPALIAEFEGVLRSASAERGDAVFRRVATLFLDSGFSYSHDQVALFDEVLSRLADRIETAVRADIAARLCDADVAPPRLLRRLALDDLLEVATPLLARSAKLGDSLLIECVETRSQGHLLAIAGRPSVSEAVTDRLVVRGEAPVLQSVADNAGSRLSNTGFATLVLRAQGNDGLAVGIGSRADLPRHHFLRLLSASSGAVRQRLEAANPQNPRDIRLVVARVTDAIAARAPHHGRDYSRALARARALMAAGALGDREILQSVNDGMFEDTIAALAALSGLEIAVVEQTMGQRRSEALLTLVRAVGLGWPTFKALVTLQAGDRGLSATDTERALSSFTRLSPETARQALELKTRQIMR